MVDSDDVGRGWLTIKWYEEDGCWSSLCTSRSVRVVL